MSGFDIVSRFFGIVLALAVTELLKGLARVWRIKHGAEGVDAGQIRVGWLVPTLAAFILVDQITFWFNFTYLAPHLPTNLMGLSGMLAVIGVYFGLSTFVVPAEVKQWPDFDAYYMKVRVIVIGGLLAVNFIALAYQIGLQASGVDILPDQDGPTYVSSSLNLLSIFSLIVLLFVRRPRTNLILLMVAIFASLAGDLPF